MLKMLEIDVFAAWSQLYLGYKKHNISPSFVTYRHTFATVEAYEKFRYAIRQPQTSYPSFPSDW